MFLCGLIKTCVKTGGALATRAKFPSAQKTTERKYIKRTFPAKQHCSDKPA